MATILSPFASNQIATLVGDCAGDVVVNDFYVDLAVGDLLLNNVIDLGVLPGGHTVTNAFLIADDLDTGGSPAITVDIGLMTGTPGDSVSVRTVGAEMFSAANAAQTGAAPVQMSLKSGYTIMANQADRSIGVKISAAPATAAAGRLRVRVMMHATSSGVQF